jgi:hypothetical protein
VAETDLIRNCLYCNNPFTVKTHDKTRQKFCSKPCSRKAGLNKTGGKSTSTCLNCNKQFDFYPSQGPGKYCCRACKKAHWQKPSVERGFIDRSGQVFGRLLVLRYAGIKTQHHSWHVQCQCPDKTEFVVMGHSLQSGRTKSCGCIAKGIGIPKPETKRCKKCKQVFPYTKEFFVTSKTFRWGLRPRCRTCLIPQLRELHFKWRRKLKAEVLAHYGNGEPQCVCCGVKHIEFLTLDHINNDGKEDRKIRGIGMNFYSKLKKSGYPPGLQTLCFNCNISRSLFGICPHNRQQ